MPIAIGTGLGLSAHFAYGMIAADGIPLPEVLAACFISGMTIARIVESYRAS
jgi:xanthine/uracil/vitamin C permease (AzgA family)